MSTVTYDNVTAHPADSLLSRNGPADRLRISFSPPTDSVTLCRITGEVDYLTAGAVRESLIGCLRAAGAVVVIDLSAVTFFGVAGLRVLNEARTWMGHTGRKLLLITGPPCVDRLLEVSGCAAIFEIIGGVADAALTTGLATS